MPAAIPFGNYELIERIAQGGMAEVWRARSLGVAGFEKIVVIKRVLPSLLARPGFAELLVREAKIAARLSHPNIVQIYDLGEQDGSYFIAMEYLRGRDLAAAVGHQGAQDRPLPLEIRLWIASEVAKALDYAHRARFEDGKPMQIVHRDVSPQNVLLGFEGEVKVADFGIARADEPGLGRGEDPKILRGKYAYMSPEQARGEPLDRRSDIFSLGIVLYELISRRRLFRGLSSTQTLEMLRAGRLPAFETYLPLDSLRPLVRRALATERADRVSSAAEIHAELNEYLFARGKPVGASELAREMRRRFPEREEDEPNKLRVDLMVRAYDDATAASQPGPTQGQDETLVATARTRMLPTSRKAKAERRRLAFLLAASRPGEGELFQDAVGRVGGEVLPPQSNLRVAVFGLVGMERAVGHAVRGALELRRLTRLGGLERVETAPQVAVLCAGGDMVDGAVIGTEPGLVERARRLLEDAGPGEISVELGLLPETGRDFRIETRPDRLVVDGFRSRRDRDAVAMLQRAPLVGRRAILRRLSARMIEAAEGRGSSVHLVGAPGIGKSRVLAEVRTSAAPHHFVFVQGRALEGDSERSFGAFADMVMDLCGIEPEDAPAQRFEKVERLRVLGLSPREVRLAGELIGLAYPVSRWERSGRPRALEIVLALRKALRALALDRVVVLALEDLQWMDDATRQVLPLLVRGIERHPVVVVLTSRSGSTGSMPAGDDWEEVLPLDVEQTRRLLAHHLGVRGVERDLAARVHELTGGVPAWIEVVAPAAKRYAVVEDEVARDGGGAFEPGLPDAVRRVVAARLEQLRARERSMLRVAAAIGGVVDVKLISSVEGLIGNTERGPLRRLWLRRLLLGTDVRQNPPVRTGAWGGDAADDRLPTRVRFPSELLRRAVLAALPDAERARLHTRIVATLERLGAAETLDGLERLGRHAAHSTDTRRAPAYFAQAAVRSMETSDRRRASRNFAEAGRLTRLQTGDSINEEACRHSLAAADAALDVGDAALARAALDGLVDAAVGASPSVRVERAILIARLARQELNAEAGQGVLEEVAALLDEVDQALGNAARILLAQAYVDHGATEQALAVLEAIIGGASEARLGAALSLKGVAMARHDELDHAEDAVNDALALAARLGDPRLRFESLAALGVLVEARGDSQMAAARYREAAEVGAGVADPDELARLHASAAVAALAAGDVGAATQRTEEAGRWAEQTRVETWGLVVAALRAALAILEHPDASWVPGLVRTVERLEELERSTEAALAVEMLVHAHLALGDPAAAGRTLDRAAVHARRAGHRNRARRLGEWRAALAAP